MYTNEDEFAEVDQAFIMFPRATCTEKDFFRKVKGEMKRRIREAEALRKKPKEKPKDPSENKVRMEGSGFFGTFLKVVGESEEESDKESEPDDRLSDSSDDDEQSERLDKARSSWSAPWQVPSRTNIIQGVSVANTSNRTNKQGDYSEQFDRTNKQVNESEHFDISSKRASENSQFERTNKPVSESGYFQRTDKYVGYGEHCDRTNNVNKVTETPVSVDYDQANEVDDDSNADSDLAEIHNCIDDLLTGSGFSMDDSGEEDSEVNANINKEVSNIQEEPEVVGSADEDSDVIEILDDESDDLPDDKRNDNNSATKVIGWGTFCDNGGRAEKRKFSSTVSGWGTFANEEGVQEKREFRRFDAEIDES